MSFREEQRDAIRAARELCYGTEVVERIRSINPKDYPTEAKAIYAIDRVLVSARHKFFG